MNIVLDYAGSLVYVADAPSLREAMEEADQNRNLSSYNVAYITEIPLNELEERVPYQVTDIPFSELASYERGGCLYGECHAYAYGLQYGSENYCDEHAGPVTEEYADVTVVWEGVTDSTETCYERAAIDKIVEDVEADIAAGHVPNPEHGAQVEASYHTHEFDTRDEQDKWDGECWCEYYETLLDTTKED